MLEKLDTLTDAGQRHLMAKVLTFIQGHVATEVPGHREHQRTPALQLLGQLRRETERPAPDLVTFRSQAETLIALLAPLG
jgi:hypothetical protein